MQRADCTLLCQRQCVNFPPNTQRHAMAYKHHLVLLEICSKCFRSQTREFITKWPSGELKKPAVSILYVDDLIVNVWFRFNRMHKKQIGFPAAGTHWLACTVGNVPPSPCNLNSLRCAHTPGSKTKDRDCALIDLWCVMVKTHHVMQEDKNKDNCFRPSVCLSGENTIFRPWKKAKRGSITNYILKWTCAMHPRPCSLSQCCKIRACSSSATLGSLAAASSLVMEAYCECTDCCCFGEKSNMAARWMVT